MHIDEHAADCLKALGEEYRHVHAWLDEMYHLTPGTAFHRAYRHHEEGVEEVRARWGDEAAVAARIHIQADYPDLAPEIPTRAMFEKGCLSHATKRKGSSKRHLRQQDS